MDRRGRKIIEVGATGLDESLQGLTSSAFGGNLGPGLRVPAAISATPGANPRYLFCLATTTGQGRIRGIRQGLTIGMNTASPAVPGRPIEMFVRTPTWKFPDGNVSWHLVAEPQLPVTVPQTDTTSWVYTQSSSAAMLYNTFTNSAVNASGQPVEYMLGLTAYTPPQITGNWQGLGGLGNMRSILFPYDNQHVWNCLDIPYSGRVSLYASILQTSPVNQTFDAAYPTGIDQSGSTPEESFAAAWYTAAGAGTGVSYWRVLGSLIVEEE